MQLRWQWRAHTEEPTAVRVLEADAVRMQEQPLQLEAAHLLVEPGIAVLFIARHRMPGVRRMHPDLVRAPRQ